MISSTVIPGIGPTLPAHVQLLQTDASPEDRFQNIDPDPQHALGQAELQCLLEVQLSQADGQLPSVVERRPTDVQRDRLLSFSSPFSDVIRDL